MLLCFNIYFFYQLLFKHRANTEGQIPALRSTPTANLESPNKLTAGP